MYQIHFRPTSLGVLTTFPNPPNQTQCSAQTIDAIFRVHQVQEIRTQIQTHQLLHRYRRHEVATLPWGATDIHLYFNQQYSYALRHFCTTHL